MYVCAPHAIWCLSRLEDDIRFPGTRDTDGCELSGRWENNLDLLQDKMILPTKTSLQPRDI